MTTSDDLTTVAWCGQVRDGMAQHLRMWGQQQDGDLALVLKSEAADRIEELERKLSSSITVRDGGRSKPRRLPDDHQ